MELKIYPLLSTESQKALVRTKQTYRSQWGHPYNYEPNGRLLKRLSTQLQMTKEQVREQLLNERKYLLTRQLNAN
jgi:hypothetical protein